MAEKLTDELRMAIRDEFVHGYTNEDGVLVYPSVDALVKRHGVARPTLYRASNREEWQKQKNQYQTQLQLLQDEERLETMLESGKRLDDNALSIAQAMLTRIGRRLAAAMREEQENPINGIEATELRELSIVAANAQRVGKLALGQAQEISKVSADVSNPEAFARVMEQLDELAEARTRQHGDSVH